MERGEKTQSQLLVASSFFLGEKKNEKTKSNKFGEEKGKTFPLPFLPYSTKQKQMCKKSMGSFFLLDSSQQFLNSPSIHPLLFPSIYFTALRPLTFDLQFHFEPISSDFSFPILGRGGGGREVVRESRYRSTDISTSERTGDEVALGRRNHLPPPPQPSHPRVQSRRSKAIVSFVGVGTNGQRHLPGFWEHHCGHMASVFNPRPVRSSM